MVSALNMFVFLLGWRDTRLLRTQYSLRTFQLLSYIIVGCIMSCLYFRNILSYDIIYCIVIIVVSLLLVLPVVAVVVDFMVYHPTMIVVDLHVISYN